MFFILIFFCLQCSNCQAPRGSAAEAGPLELKLRELCMTFDYNLARPATSDEVQRISFHMSVPGASSCYSRPAGQLDAEIFIVTAILSYLAAYRKDLHALPLTARTC